MTLYIVYYQFVDDPSVVRGVYSTLEKAEAAKLSWGNTYGVTPEILMVTLDVDEDGDGLVLS
jgi:hypothetical protein